MDKRVFLSICGDQYVNVNPDDVKSLLNLESGTPTVIVFIDRFAEGGYQFHPVRLGRLLNVTEEANRLYFQVRLERLLYPTNKTKFNMALHEKLDVIGLPKLTNSDPATLNDGYYALQGQSVFDAAGDFHYDGNAFPVLSNELNTARSFRVLSETEEGGPRETVFARAIILKRGNEIVVPKEVRNQHIFEIENKATHSLRISYIYPAQDIDRNKTAQIRVDFGENLQPHGNNLLVINARDRRTEVLFSGSSAAINQEDGISFTYSSLTPNVNVLGVSPDKRIHIQVTEVSGFIYKLFGLTAIFAVGGFLTSLDSGLVTNIYCRAALDLLGTLLQAFAFYLGLRFIGHRISF